MNIDTFLEMVRKRNRNIIILLKNLYDRMDLYLCLFMLARLIGRSNEFSVRWADKEMQSKEEWNDCARDKLFESINKIEVFIKSNQISPEDPNLKKTVEEWSGRVSAKLVEIDPLAYLSILESILDELGKIETASETKS